MKIFAQLDNGRTVMFEETPRGWRASRSDTVTVTPTLLAREGASAGARLQAELPRLSLLLKEYIG